MGINEIIKIGDNIKFYRQVKFMTQSYVAEKLDIPRSTYANYENNTREPDKEILTKVAIFLDISITELLEGPNSLNYEILELLKNKNIDINTLSKEIKLSEEEIKKCLINVKAFFPENLIKIGLYIGLRLEYLNRHIKFDDHRLHIKQNFNEINTDLDNLFNKWINTDNILVFSETFDKNQKNYNQVNLLKSFVKTVVSDFSEIPEEEVGNLSFEIATWIREYVEMTSRAKIQELIEKRSNESNN